jgi:hypothetical protein
MSKRKAYRPKDPVIENLRNIAYKMQNNSLTVSDTYSLLLGYQHIFYVQGIAKEGLHVKHQIKYLNKVKTAFEKALHKIVGVCWTNEEGYLCGDQTTPVKVHKFTRQKIAWFCTMFATAHKSINKQLNAKLIRYARETLDISIIARDLPLRQFLYQ